MRNQGIGSWTARRASKTPDRLAVVYQDQEWTYRHLHERVLRLAHGLRRLGAAAAGSPTSARTTPPSWRPCSPRD
jgi:fatty-acyl-CoA synthase